jgi:hypothetical protein
MDRPRPPAAAVGRKLQLSLVAVPCDIGQSFRSGSMFVIAGMIAAAASTSAPVYLRCSFPTAPVEVLVAADEANRSVTMTLPGTGWEGTVPAAFSANDLAFDNRVLAVRINRTNLTATRRARGDRQSTTGTCKIEDAPKRAF